MKRYGNLFEKIYDFDNLYMAHCNARRGKTHYKEVQEVDECPVKYILKIQGMLFDKTYKTSGYKVFLKIDKNKEREIYALPYYPDRIIQWAIVQVLEPIWMKQFISGTYSSLKGRGIHKALRDLRASLHDGASTKYCLKLDIRKFYPSIDHQILKEILRKKIKDIDVLALLDGIIDSAPGVPIGNYLSQYFSNLYLNDFDHWIKESQHIKHYFRYCDDIVILSGDKQELRQLFSKIERYLCKNLKLKIKSNYQVFPTHTRGIDFVGYRCFGNYTLIRKSIAKMMKKRVIPLHIKSELNDHDRCVIGSYSGWLIWGDTYRLSLKYIHPLSEKMSIRGNRNGC